LSGTLIAQLEKFMADYPETGFIVIDTFQRIRGNVDKISSRQIDFSVVTVYYSAKRHTAKAQESQER